MSDPIFPLAVWQEGTLQNDVPANDNSLRVEAMSRLVISDSTTAQPGSPADGDVYIIPASATGTQWGTFTEGDVAIYRGGTWIAFAPVLGVVVNVAGTQKQWTGSAWEAISGGSASGVSIVTEASPFSVDPGTHAGVGRYIRAGGSATFDVAEGYAAGQVYNLRATGSISLIGTGVTLTPPAGGTLAMTAAMSVSVIMTSSSAGDVIGQTVPA